jgi:DNA-directed RNA polymerase specialized sigma24 family protein
MATSPGLPFEPRRHNLGAMVPENSPRKSVDPLHLGDPQAAEAIFDKYAARLTRLAEQHLSRRLTGRVGGEDVVQSVFRTFFRRAAGGEFHIDSSIDLWKLLVRITLMKARAVGRRHTAGCRDATAEVAPRDDDWLPEALSREPGPQDAALLVDEIEAVLRGLPELYCRVLELRLEGHTVADVAGELGVSRQTIYRALELLQQRLSASQR